MVAEVDAKSHDPNESELANVIRDITGLTGQAIIRSIWTESGMQKNYLSFANPASSAATL